MDKFSSFAKFLESMGKDEPYLPKAWHDLPWPARKGVLWRAVTEGVTPWLIVAFVLVTALFLLTLMAAHILISVLGMPGSTAVQYPLLLVLGILLAVIVFRVGRAMSRDLSRRPCWKCGYSLIALTEPRCPKCGTPFDEDEYDQIEKTQSEAE